MIHIDRTEAAAGLAWGRGFLASFDSSRVEWVRIDRGRGQYEGVYGRCWLPTPQRPTYRLSCQVPGPFPCEIQTRRSPLYRRSDGTFPRAPRGCRRGVLCLDRRSGRSWYRVLGSTRVQTVSEGIVWILAHEAFHFLRGTRQVPGRNTEIEADRFADEHLGAFRSAQGTGIRRGRGGQLVLPWGLGVGTDSE